LIPVLFSPQHGLFYWHPLLLVGGGAFFYATVRGIFPVTWLLSLIGIIYLNASWWCWWFASSFGNRAFEGAVFFFMAGLGFLWDQTSPRTFLRWGLITVLGAGILFNGLLLILYMKGYISREDAVTYNEILQAAGHLLRAG
jgi:hypothetical protein